MKSSITFRDLSFDWPDGQVALERLTGSFGAGRTALVGRNGEGKSTLLRLIAGELEPTSGQLDVVGEVGYLAQTLTLQVDTTVADLLGISAVIAALTAIEAGDVDERHFDVVGDDWDARARAAEALHEIGLPGLALERRVSEVSGGEAMLIAITGLRLRRTPITLFDEPTNNLDATARHRVASLVDSWPGTLIVVSHDLDLLKHLDNTAELHAGRLDVFGGTYSAYADHLDRQQAAAAQAARSAQQALKVEKRQRIDAETTLARRDRTAQKTQRDGGIPKILAGARADRAQGSAGALRGTLDGKVAAAQAAVDEADARLRDDEHIHLVLPDPQVPRGRRLAQLHGAAPGRAGGGSTLVIQGPERVALVGPNGSGKTSLLESLVTGIRPASGAPFGVLLTDRVGYLPQRQAHVAEQSTALEAVLEVAPHADVRALRNQLARLLLRGATVDRPVRTLSGGERFRVGLARLLLAEPASQLLILDEPTNNLDLASVQQLGEALGAYRGALLIVSHDDSFLRTIGITTTLALDRDGTLTETAGFDATGQTRP